MVHPGDQELHDKFCHNTIRIVNAIELHVDDTFIVILEDIMESNFGKGICFGKVGYTIDEWNQKYNDSIHLK